MVLRRVKGTSSWLIAAGWVYFTVLFVWIFFYFLTGDRISIIALINNLAVYLFAPLPLLFLQAIIFRRREFWVGAGVGFLVFMYLWGGQFVPDYARGESGGESLTVMTYNVLGRHTQTDPVLATIITEGADVILLQELNPSIATALTKELSSVYPHQILDPRVGVTGMGVISRYPLEVTGERLPLDWVGVPQLVALDWEGHAITVINFHMYPGGLGTSAQINYVNRLREAQARVLDEFASRAARHGPVIAAGDANVTSLSDAYRIMTQELADAWQSGGRGLGHTFPGSAIPGSSRPRLAGWPVPQWLARIDYIFHSRHWEVDSVRLARFDGVSDHRGVIAEMFIAQDR